MAAFFKKGASKRARYGLKDVPEYKGDKPDTPRQARAELKKKKKRGGK